MKATLEASDYWVIYEKTLVQWKSLSDYFCVPFQVITKSGDVQESKQNYLYNTNNRSIQDK